MITLAWRQHARPSLVVFPGRGASFTCSRMPNLIYLRLACEQKWLKISVPFLMPGTETQLTPGILNLENRIQNAYGGEMQRKPKQLYVYVGLKLLR